MTPQTRQITIGDGVVVSVDEAGDGRPALVLHGGGGPATTQPIATHLAAGMHVLAPTHPGFMGTPRPDSISTVPALAAAYLRLLAAEGLYDVLVVGNSLGGWIAMEMAVSDVDGRVGALVLIDSAGICLPDEPMADFFALAPDEIAQYSFYDPSKSPLDPASLDAAARTTFARNSETMRVLAGDPYMHDPGLQERLGALTIPALVVWGDADRMFPPAHGYALADSIPGARFRLLSRAGHLPQFEEPGALFDAIDTFADTDRGGTR